MIHSLNPKAMLCGGSGGICTVEMHVATLKYNGATVIWIPSKLGQNKVALLVRCPDFTDVFKQACWDSEMCPVY